MKLTEKDLMKIEDQLSNPKGNTGLEIAKNMHKTNFSMTKATFDASNIVNNDVVLEIGHGNCNHLDYVFSLAENVFYYGLEISETMYSEAKKQIRLKEENQSVFKLYDGVKIPFNASSFDKIVTVNTICFWETPVLFLNEICRVLKEGGTCVICFADEGFMKKLPFVKEKFTLYNVSKIKEIVTKSTLELIDVYSNKENVISKSGDKVLREYHVVILKK